MSTKKIANRNSTTTKRTVGPSRSKIPRDESSDRKDEKTSAKTNTVSKIHNKKQGEDAKTKTPSLIPQSRKKIVKETKIKNVASVPRISHRTAKPERPATPPSSRVSKSQFFPSKKMYSNALKEEEGVKIKSKAPVQTEIAIKSVKGHSINTVASRRRKESHNETFSDNSSLSERPRTATLVKGSIVNNNIVGPEAPKIITHSDLPAEEYADDFDSYESDFEEYNSSDSTTNVNVSEMSTGVSSSSESDQETKTPPKRTNSASTDDEKKLDSGNFELPESRHKQMLDEIQESGEKEHLIVNNNFDQSRSNLGSLSDEGFEDAKSLQFINFLGAQKRYQHRNSVEKKRKRGEDILSMIRLDTYSFTLLDIAPVPYEEFIKNFGKSNTVQASVQTGDDDLNEETQTEQIFTENKWTQYPTVFPKFEETENFWTTYRAYSLGVGGDTVNTLQHNIVTNESNLENFLQAAGNLILNIQGEETIASSQGLNSKSNIPFSKEFVLFDVNKQSYLKSRKLKNASFCSNNSNKILTVHGNCGKDDVLNSIICLWNICNVLDPEMIFTSFGEISCCAVSIDFPNLIFAGLDNGTLVLWDTKESSTSHKLVERDREFHVAMRTPTYSTEARYGHSSKIVAIQSLKKISTEADMFYATQATEVCSLDEDGELIIWSVIFKTHQPGSTVEDQGLAHWGSVVIVINIVMSIKTLHPEIIGLQCTDLGLSQTNPNHLYVATNYGIIVHCLSNGSRHNVKKFLPEDMQSQANCLETCPYSSEYFVVGFDNGDISFYSQLIEKPLMVMSNKDSVMKKDKIEIIQWSLNRPLMFYTKDASNTMHVWNLNVSDLFPTYSIPFKDEIVGIKLSPVTKSEESGEENTYMLVATSRGVVYVHLLDEEHGRQSFEQFESDKSKFFNYIKRYS